MQKFVLKTPKDSSIFAGLEGDFGQSNEGELSLFARFRNPPPALVKVRINIQAIQREIAPVAIAFVDSMQVSLDGVSRGQLQ